MWIWMALASALLLGLYDVAKKAALEHNGKYWILISATALSAVMLSPFLTPGILPDHLRLVFKALLVTTSWVTGMVALELLPITTVSTFKASRPVFVILFSVLLFRERPNPLQWAGVAVVLVALWLLSVDSSREGISFTRNKGVGALVTSVAAGVASALWDKHIMMNMEPLFVQSWTNVYITLMLAAVILFRAFRGKKETFKLHWTLPLIAVLITAADMLYFFALKQDGAMLSIISLVRRGSVIVTFVVGAILFKEKRIASKGGILLLVLTGLTLLVVSSL